MEEEPGRDPRLVGQPAETRGENTAMEDAEQDQQQEINEVEIRNAQRLGGVHIGRVRHAHFAENVYHQVNNNVFNVSTRTAVCLVVVIVAAAFYMYVPRHVQPVTQKDTAEVGTSGGSVPGKTPDQFGPSDTARDAHLKSDHTQTSASISNTPGQVFRQPDRATCNDEMQSTISATYTSSFPLHVAIRRGDQDTVYDLIHSREAADINQKDNAGNTPLHIAASMGSQRLVNTLIKKGAKVNAGNERGRYPIHEACRSGHLEVVQILCEHGADVNVEDRQGASPLTEAIEQYLDTIFDYLLDHGANIEANSSLESGKLLRGASRNSAFLTPLNIAAQLNSEYYVAKLLQRGAKLNIPDGRGWEPLHTAAFHNRFANVLQLLKADNPASVDALTKDTKATTALCLASQEGHFDVVVILLSHGAHVNHTQDDGANALFLAAQSGHADLVDTLLKHGANINVTLKGEASTPLFMAVQEGHAKVVNKILDHDRLKRQSASSAMCLAAFSGHLSVVKALLDHGASVDAKNATEKRTPLVYACQEGHLSVVRYLLDHGADISGKGGLLPLYMATYTNRIDIVRELAQRGADVNYVPFPPGSLLGIACNYGYAEVAAILIDHGAHLGLYTENNNLYYMNGYTYLMIAAYGNHAGVAKVLIDRGADVNAQHHVRGETALLLAANYGNAEVAKVLLQHRARQDLRAVGGVSPLHQASLFGNHEVVEQLLSHGKTPYTDLQEAFFEACGCDVLYRYIEKECPEPLREKYYAIIKYASRLGGSSSDLSSNIYALGEMIDQEMREDYKKGIIKIDIRIQEAYKSAFEETVIVFLRHGVDVNVKDDRSGSTALHEAVSGENLRIVQLLVEHGADVNAKNKFGRTALDDAMKAGHTDIVDYLKNAEKVQQKQKSNTLSIP